MSDERSDSRWANLPRLQRVGLTSWLLLGIIGLIVVILLALGAVSGIVIPLVIAVILGTVLEPLVEALERRGVKPLLASIAALVVALALAAGTVAIVVSGFLQQLPEISNQLLVGWQSMVKWARSLEIDSVWLEQARIAFQNYAPKIGQGALGAVSSTFSGAVSFAVGSFFAVFFLFFVLRDARGFPAWLARVTRLDPGLSEEVIGVAKQSLRGYFKGTAITALITAPIFLVPLLVLRIPLAVPIFILYFFTSFIPFVGAWIAGAFAVLIAFGSGGASAALIIAITILVSNGGIQSAVSSWALGTSLKMHPIAVLLATIIGGTVAGIIGMVLGAPLLAAVIRSVAVFARHRAADGLDAAERARLLAPTPTDHVDV